MARLAIAQAIILVTLAAPLTHASAATPHPYVPPRDGFDSARLAHASAATRHLHDATHQVKPAFNPQPDPPVGGHDGVRPSFDPQPTPPGGPAQ